MMRQTILALCFTIICATAGAAGNKAAVPKAAPAAGPVLGTLKPGHPRLLLDEAALARVKELIAGEPLAAKILASIRAEARKALRAKPSIYEKPDGRRLLSVSRTVKERVLALGFIHRLEGGDPYRERIWREVQAAAAFPDWNPAHFLDTAEMTFALAVAYDWLYDQWTPQQRRTLREAIVTHGLEPALKVYAKNSGWVVGDNNWNQVCNGGIGLGALAIADEEPQLAARILDYGLRSLPHAMGYYAPDGAGTEGATYWDYGTRYNLLFVAGLRTALGTDFGLSKLDGFGPSGDYQIYLSGAGRRSFDFGDCGLTILSTPQHFWLAREYDRPQYSWFRYSILAGGKDQPGLLDLLWFDARGKNYDPAALPLDKYFRKAEVASMRSSWSDPDALVLGIEAGHNSTNGHRHMDLGSFILEAGGQRWAIDSGTEHETYMTHRNHIPRYDFYRTRAEGHNTLVIDPDAKPDQEIAGEAPMVRFESTPRLATAQIDLSGAYAGRAKSVRRTFAMIDRKCVTIQDAIQTGKPAEIWWFMHTEAAIQLGADGRTATLQSKGKSLRAELVEPAAAKFQVMEAAPLPASPNPKIQAGNKGRRKLAIHLEGVNTVTLSVKLTPGEAGR